MKRLLTVAILACFSLAVHSQDLVYDVDFQYLFDNREYDAGGNAFQPSMTASGVWLSPFVGVIVPYAGSSSVIMFGADFYKEMSQSEKKDLWRETIIYWKSVLPLKNGGEFEAICGVYPRRVQKGLYSRIFISDDYAFYDRNLDGMLLQWNKPELKAELGLDWIGLKTMDSRECFQVYSSLKWDFAPRWSLGSTISFYHLSSSEVVHSVVDNTLAEPWLLYESEASYFDDARFRLGIPVGYQRDRVVDKRATIPVALEFEMEFVKNNIRLENSLVAGNNLMTYYNTYGTILYQGDAFYAFNRNSGSVGFLDRLDLSYSREIGEFLSLSAGATFFAGKSGYLGWRQFASLKFNLDKFKNR